MAKFKMTVQIIPGCLVSVGGKPTVFVAIDEEGNPQDAAMVLGMDLPIERPTDKGEDDEEVADGNQVG